MTLGYFQLIPQVMLDRAMSENKTRPICRSVKHSAPKRYLHAKGGILVRGLPIEA
jgi:hypothetical protein